MYIGDLNWLLSHDLYMYRYVCQRLFTSLSFPVYHALFACYVAAPAKQTKAPKSRGGKRARLPFIPALSGLDPNSRADPGGKVIWAKHGNNPWWPAKTLEEDKDLSYPAKEEPPRPTSIAIRFFGTHEFAWLGSKRQMADWKDVSYLSYGFWVRRAFLFCRQASFEYFYIQYTT